MTKSALGAGLLATLFAAVPVAQADAQQASSFALRSSPERANGGRLFSQPRVDPLRLRGDEFNEPYDLVGIPLTGDRKISRERGFSVSVRPSKGLRAVAKLRF